MQFGISEHVTLYVTSGFELVCCKKFAFLNQATVPQPWGIWPIGRSVCVTWNMSRIWAGPVVVLRCAAVNCVISDCSFNSRVIKLVNRVMLPVSFYVRKVYEQEMTCLRSSVFRFSSSSHFSSVLGTSWQVANSFCKSSYGLPLIIY
jgi:hypothetical protein